MAASGGKSTAAKKSVKSKVSVKSPTKKSGTKVSQEKTKSAEAEEGARKYLSCIIQSLLVKTCLLCNFSFVHSIGAANKEEEANEIDCLET